MRARARHVHESRPWGSLRERSPGASSPAWLTVRFGGRPKRASSSCVRLTAAASSGASATSASMLKGSACQ